jgi:alanine racemase
VALILHVHGERWRAAQDAAHADHPGLVPVVKGNGYGFGRDLLLGEAHRLGVPMVAVGTYTELPEALAGFAHDVLVLEPYRAVIHGDLPDLHNRRVVHTVTARAVNSHRREADRQARVVI